MSVFVTGGAWVAGLWVWVKNVEDGYMRDFSSSRGPSQDGWERELPAGAFQASKAFLEEGAKNVCKCWVRAVLTLCRIKKVPVDGSPVLQLRKHGEVKEMRFQRYCKIRVTVL